MTQLSGNEAEVARIMQDPVLWVEAHLNEKPRWYQQQALRHPHNRTVFRWGRRLGKCIAEGQRILDAKTGKYETIEKLFSRGNFETYSLNNNYKIEKDTVFRIEENGVKPVFEIEVSNGSKVQLTGNHPVLTVDGWKEVDDLNEGESIATPKELPVFGPYSPDEKRIKTMAYILATYKRTNKGIILELTNSENRQEMSDLIRDYGVMLYPKSKQSFFMLDKTREFDFITKHEQSVMPEEVYEYDKKSLAIFIAALFDAKGYLFNKHVPEISYTTDDETFARTLRHLLLRFGIQAKIKQRVNKTHVTPSYNVLMNNNKDVRQFLEYFTQFAVRDYSSIQEQASEMSAYSTMIPKQIWPYIEEKRLEKGLKKIEVMHGNKSDKYSFKLNISEEKMKVYSETLQNGYLYDLARSDILWQEVVSIKPLGEKMTYDVMMPAYHNLIVEDICVHNTWTMTAHMLWAAYTNIGGKKKEGRTVCLVATPYDSQAREIFDQLRTFINDSEILTSSVKSITKNPYYIEFHNGSKIKLYTTGAKTGAGGASIRGQQADYIYLDK